MKNIKKLIALLLALVMALSVMPLAFAGEITYEQDCPYIYIHGFVGNTIYDDPSNPNARAVFPPSSDDILKTVERCIPAIGVYLVNRDGDMLSDTLVPELLDLFGEVFLDKDGNIQNTSGIKFSYPPKSSINAQSNLAFEYDWRLDPMELADQLNDFIDYVLDASGCEQVTIMAHSCGGVVALAYTSKYGMDKIKGIVMNSTAVYGETYTGELMTGDIRIDIEALKCFLEYALGEVEYNELINGVIAAFTNAGLFDFLEKFGNELIADIDDRVMGEVIFPMFTRMPTIWAMTPDEYVENAKEYVYNCEYCDKSLDYSVIQAKVDNYNTAVRANREAMLYELAAKGHFGVYARYGFSSIPITASWQNLSDGVVDTKFASYGATTAKYGETLPEDYIAGVDAKYISPDRTVDASTCMFPEKTWFVKNFGHTSSQLYPVLTKAILYADTDVTVDTYEEYPRFTIYENGEFAPQTEDDTLTPFEKIIAFFKSLIKLIKALFSSISA